MNTQKLFLATIISFSLFSCGGEEQSSAENSDANPSEESVEESVELLDASWQDLSGGELMPEQKVVFEGYVGQLGTSIADNGGEYSINIYQRRNQIEGFYLATNLTIGSENNQMSALPEEYENSDLQIKTDDGSIVNVGDYIKIEGSYGESANYNYKFITGVSKIEKLASPNPENNFEEAVELTDEVCDDNDPANESIYTYMDVDLKSQSMGSFSNRHYTIIIEQENNSYIDEAKLLSGDGNSMTTLPDPYIEGKPFTLRDVNGEEFDSSNKVRLYGTFVHQSGSRKGVFYAEEIVKL